MRMYEQTSTCEWTADLGPARVTVGTDHPEVVAFLQEYYRLTPGASSSPADWTVEGRLGTPDAGMPVNGYGVGHTADRRARHAVIIAPDLRGLQITLRKALREALLEHCEARGYTMLHASAVANHERVIIVVGDKGSGKTTLALNAFLTEEGYQYLSNDHLILYRGQDGPVITSVPTPLPVKIGTYLDYEAQLGTPWENEGVDIAAYRRMPRAERFRHGDVRLLFTYRGLGQDNPVHVGLAHREVVVVLARYADADGDEPVGAPTEVLDPMAELWPHVRFDWSFNPASNTHFLPREERDERAYAEDAGHRLAELTGLARVVRWRHHGRISPLLEELDRTSGVMR